MSVLTVPQALCEMNGSLWHRVNEYEPLVAELGEYLPSPLTLSSESTTRGVNYGRQVVESMVDVELDSNGRVTTEVGVTLNSEYGTQTVHTLREWQDGSDHEETIHIEPYDGEDDIETGYRHTLDDGSLEVKLHGVVYNVNQETLEGGNTFWKASRDDGFVFATLVDITGRILADSTTNPGGDTNTVTYSYDSDGKLVQLTGPGNITIGSSNTPEPRITRLRRKEELGGGYAIDVTTRVFPGEEGDPESFESRRYDNEGHFIGAKTVSGFCDIGQITTDYVIENALTSI